MNLPDAAAKCHARSLLTAILAAASIEEVDPKGRTALFRAARVGRLENVCLLLQHGANPDAKCGTGEAPLQAAARYGHLECVRELVTAGAVLNYCPDPAQSEYSETALCSAVRRNHPEVVRFLLDAGADPNAGSAAERFPLHEAAAWGIRPLCKMLACAGADLNLLSKGYGRPLHAAIGGSAIDTIQELLDLGADVNASDSRGFSSIMHAAMSIEGSVELVFAVLKGKPKLNLKNAAGETVLDLARSFKKDEVIRILGLLGAPETEPDEQEPSIIILPDGSEMEVEFVTNQDNWRIDVSAEKGDHEMAAALPSCPKLASYLGWRSSFAHWEVLWRCHLSTAGGAKQALSLSRLAYFVRGCQNRPVGTELNDGPSYLGESHQEAVDRFVNEGLLAVAGPLETILAVTTVSELKNIAKRIGFEVRGTKDAIVEQLLCHQEGQPFEEILLKHRLYVGTPAVDMELEQKAGFLEAAQSRLLKETLDALIDGDLLWGASLAQNLIATRSSFRKLSPEDLCRARLVLSNPIPNYVKCREKDSPMLRAIAALHVWEIVKEDTWNLLFVSAAPTHRDRDLSPSRFARLILVAELSDDIEDTWQF